MDAHIFGLVFLMAGALAAPRSLLQQGLESIPEKCLDAGLAMQNDCAREIEQGSEYFGVQPGSSEAVSELVNQEDEIQAYLQNAEKPSSSCCRAASKFNQERCSCDPQMLSVVSGFTGGSTRLYETIARYFGDSCGFNAFVGSSC